MKFVPHLFWCCGTNCTENKRRKASINIEAKWGTDLRGNCPGAEIYGHHRFPIYLECGRPWPPPSLESLLLHKPIGASPRRDEDGTILVCSTYSTYTVRIGTSKKGGNAPRATDKKSMYVVSILILRKPRC
jgi:hypothetical protein